MIIKHSYKDLTYKLKNLHRELKLKKEKLNCADNANTRKELIIQVNNLENEVMILDDYIERIISRGRE